MDAEGQHSTLTMALTDATPGFQLPPPVAG
jgi:hypothetical protein